MNGTEYTVIVKQTDAPKESVKEKLRRALMKDLSERVRSEGENL